MLMRISPPLGKAFALGAVAMFFVLPTAPVAAETEDFLAAAECAGGGCRVEAETPGTSTPDTEGPAVGGTGEVLGAGGEGRSSCVTPDLEFAQSGAEGPHQMPLDMARCEDSANAVGGVEFDPAVMAEQARAVMRLPDPGIGTAPSLGKPRFVNMPSWMWIDAADWESVSATASVSAGSVTVVATPERVVWDTGDGHEVVCEGPGTVFSRATYREEGSPDCGHTYTALPPGGAGATVDLAAVWEWGVSWSTSDGRGGSLEELTTTSTVAVPVSEIHSVVTHIR